VNSTIPLERTLKIPALYKSKEWFEFRSIQLAQAKFCCELCSRSRNDGAVLQVHHLKYDFGKKPWEYAAEEVQVLCKGCHAELHLKKLPTKDWDLVGVDDLGGLDGECDYCSTPIRHVHFIEHGLGHSMVVGEICCDNFTESKMASDYRKYELRKETFIKSTRWTTTSAGSQQIVHSHETIFVRPCEGKWQIVVDGHSGKQAFESAEDAKSKLFELIESGEIKKYLKSKRKVETAH
jgi:5-methylcytosine-specific restriction endonuclease McrA